MLREGVRLLGAAFVILICAVAKGQAKSRPFPQLFLASDPVWLEHYDQRGAAVFFDSTTTVGIGERFYIVLSSSKIIRGRVIKILSANSLGGLDSMQLSAALLKLERKIDWDHVREFSDYKMLIAVRGHRPAPDQVGDVRELTGAERDTQVRAIHGYLPPGRWVGDNTLYIIHPPDRKGEFLIASFFYYKTPKGPYVDHEALLFRIGSDRPQLLQKFDATYSQQDCGVIGVIGVTDLARDGRWQILAPTCEPCGDGACFGLYRFDQKSLDRHAARYLFGWDFD